MNDGLMTPLTETREKNLTVGTCPRKITLGPKQKLYKWSFFFLRNI